jgi:hypothetical protein
MTRPLFVMFFVCISGLAMSQQLENDPVRMGDPASLNSQSRQPLPRDEIPGTIRRTQEDFNMQPLNHFPDIGQVRNATDTASMYFLDDQGKPVRDLRQVYQRSDPIPDMRRATPADTLDYIPNIPRDSLPVSTDNR